MTTISDLPGDLVAEILSKLPITSLSAVRSTCKRWNSLSKTQIIFDQEASRKQFLGFMVIDYRVFSLRFNLHGLRNYGKFVDPSIKQISKLNHVEISQVFHCDGLLLCVTRDKSTLLIWNPYLGQTRTIQPREKFHSYDRYALGYDNNKHNHKILRIFDEHETGNHVFGYEIYNCSCDSWRVLDINPDWWIPFCQRGVSLKSRKTYFVAREELEEAENEIIDLNEHEYCFLVSFDLQRRALDRVFLCHFTHILDKNKPPTNTCRYHKAYILGQDGYFKPVDIGEATDLRKSEKLYNGNGYIYCVPLVCSSYVPSLVQLQTNQPRNKKERRDY